MKDFGTFLFSRFTSIRVLYVQLRERYRIPPMYHVSSLFLPAAARGDGIREFPFLVEILIIT